MDLSDSIFQDFPDTVRITGAYIIFYEGGPIEPGTHVPGVAAQSGAESDYNAAFTAGMTLSDSRMAISELLNKNLYVTP